METAAQAVSQALQSVSSPTSRPGARPSKPVLSQALTDLLWARMASRYGGMWVANFGDEPAGLVASEWRESIGAVDADDLDRGFARDLERASQYPPSSAVFAAMCRPDFSDAPRTFLGSPPIKRAALAIESDQGRATAKREIAAMCKLVGISPPEDMP